MSPHRHADLAEIARRAMVEHGLEPRFSPAALHELDAIVAPAAESGDGIADLRALPWCSIDNDDSRDLDQLTVGEALAANAIKVRIAIADVDALVHKATAIDQHAQHNTTSVYTAARIFPMLPERLSTDLTSLNPDQDRLAMIVEYTVAADGSVAEPSVYRARVRNQAKLAYDSVSEWLDGKAAAPAALTRVPGLDEGLRIQDRAAQALRTLRHERGALDLETIEPRAVMRDGEVVDLRPDRKTRAAKLIEDFMIAANGVTARFLESRRFPTLRRVIRSPERWDKIEALAASFGTTLPPDPDAAALEQFLVTRRRADPLRFPDLSLTIVKLLGAGEYVAAQPGLTAAGHFGLAVRDYVHSTAPNRRYPDVITQRLLKAALAGSTVPYEPAELDALAHHCTEQEDAANKVERQVRKSAAAMLLESRIGERFDSIVTGASAKGTWVRALKPPVEGKVVMGAEGLDVGDRVTVKLVGVDVDRGFIDFVRG